MNKPTVFSCDKGRWAASENAFGGDSTVGTGTDRSQKEYISQWGACAVRHVLQEERARALNWSVAHYSLACQLIGGNCFVRLVFHKLISSEPPPHTRPQLPPPPLFFLRGAWWRVTRLTDSSTLAEIRNRAIRVFSRTFCPQIRGRWTDSTRPRAQCRWTQAAVGTQRCRRCPLAIDASTFCHCVSLHWILWRLDWFFCTEIPVMSLAKRTTPYQWAQKNKNKSILVMMPVSWRRGKRN